MVEAIVDAQPKEIPVTKAKSKRKPASRANKSKAEVRNSVKRTTARTAVQAVRRGFDGVSVRLRFQRIVVRGAMLKRIA